MQTDPQNERERLTAHYAQMSDGQLEDLAHSAADLTVLAREALQREIDNRKLGVVLDLSSDTLGSPSSLVTVRSFRDVSQAYLGWSVLESTGIECFLIDENIVRMDWFLSNAVGGVKLRLREEDAMAAIELLDQSPVETFDVEGVGEYQQPRCPNCNSLDIADRELIKPVAYGSLAGGWLVGIVPPIPLRRIGWKCHACRHAWEENDGANG